jgi:hypothetical protein
MRARVAYISSLGTTAILVAAALLMLAVVGALVAFHGWPGSANGAVVQPVPLGSGGDRASTLIVRPVASTGRVVRVGSFSRLAASRARLSTAGLVKRAAPAVASGLVMDPVPAATMRPASPGSRGGSNPAPAVTPAIGPPQGSGDPTPVGDPGGQLPGVPSVAPGSPPSTAPQPPSSDAVVAMVGELIGGTPPPPGLESVVASLTRR